MALTATSAPLASPTASAIGGSLEDLLAELGYRDCIGALHRYRVEHPRDVELLSIFLMDYPFADRLFPAALVVLKWLNSLGPTVILSTAMSCSNHARSSTQVYPTPCTDAC